MGGSVEMPPATDTAAEIQAILDREGREAAAKGNEALNAWVRTLNRSEKSVVAETIGAELRQIAELVDRPTAAIDDLHVAQQDAD